MSFRTHHGNAKTCEIGSRNEALVAIENPFAIFESGAAGQLIWIRPRAWVRLCHTETRLDLTCSKRCKIALFLLWSSNQTHHVHVAFIGGHDVERRRANRRVAGLLKDVWPVRKRQTLPAKFWRHMRSEDASLLG